MRFTKFLVVLAAPALAAGAQQIDLGKNANGVLAPAHGGCGTTAGCLPMTGGNLLGPISAPSIKVSGVTSAACVGTDATGTIIPVACGTGSGFGGTSTPTYQAITPSPNATLTSFTTGGQTLSLTFAPAASDRLEAVVSGSTITVMLNGVPLTPTTDYTLSGGGSSPLTPVTYLTAASTSNPLAYTLSTGQTITLTFAPAASDTLDAQVTGSGVAGVLAVMLNSAALAASDYTVTLTTSGSTGGSGGGSGGSGTTYGSNVTAPTPTVAPSTGQAVTGTALSACRALTSSGTYYLSQDVTCTTQGFSIQADNILLNLNGHNLTYGNPSTIIPAVSGCASYYSGGSGINNSLPAAACGGSQKNVHVQNGTITQAANAAPFTHAFYFGEGNPNGGEIDHLTINIAATGTQAFFGQYPGNGWNMHDLVINDSVTNIQMSGQSALGARSNFQGYAILLANGYGSTNSGDTSGPGDTFTNIVINGSPQGGILTTNKGVSATYNTITLTSKYSNDYGIFAAANGTSSSSHAQVAHNTVMGRGRGIDVEASNVDVLANLINVHEESNNPETGACELTGDEAIRVKQYTSPYPCNGLSGGSLAACTTNNNTGSNAPVPEYSGVNILGNSVTVDATSCDAYGIGFSNATHNLTATVANNVVSVTGSGHGNNAAAIVIDGAATPAITWTTNSFSAQTRVAAPGDGDLWPSENVVIQSGQTWTDTGGGPTIIARDVASGQNTLPEAITILDAVSGTPTYNCSSYSTALLTVGTWTHQCP